jgi:hypothetical protein
MTKIWGILISLFISIQGAYAINPGAISSATAGSGRASVEATESPFLNPATIPYLRGYIFTSSYNSTGTKSSDLTFSITDNMKETVIPTSLGYSQSTLRPTEDTLIKSQDLRIAVGEKVGNRFGAGLAVHHKNDRSEFDSYAQTNMTVAGVWAVNNSLSAGLVFDDIIGASSDIPEFLRLKSKTSMALSYNHKRVIRAKVDLISGGNNSFVKPTLVGGVETFMNRWLILRVGVGRDSEASAGILSGGIGFQGPKFGIHYAYLESRENESLTRHTVDLAIPVW